MKRLLLFLMALVLSIPIWAGEKTIVINRNEGIYEDGTGAYYCTKGGITMTFSSGLNNVNYLVEHQQVVFDIFSTNYVIKKIKFNCLDNTTDDNLDCFYWGPSTISEFSGAPYTPTGSYTWSDYIGTWVGGSTPSKYVKFVTEAKPVRFGSVEITIDKEFGDIYEKVTTNEEIVDGHTYALVSQYASKALSKEDYYGNDNLTTFTSTPVTLLDNNNKVKVTDEVQLIKLQSSGDSSRPWYLKVGDNYIRRRSSLSGSTSGAANGQGYNLYGVSAVTSYEEYFRVNITVSGNNNQNALIRFNHGPSEPSFAIRHYNGGSLFRDMDYSSNNSYAANQRVYLYKPAQSYEVTTECIPADGGYITLGGGILTDNNGHNLSQHFDNVTFFVGSANGYGIGDVTLTDLNGRAVTVLQPTATSDFGNDYSFEMPANNVKITANFLQPYNIDTICAPRADAGRFDFISGYTDFNGQHKSNEGKTVTFKPVPADGYIFNSVTITNNGETTTLTPDANGVYSFVMPGNNVTLTADFEAASDLYLLGTANGKTGWEPKGPKFTYDAENEKYYIDVYFKGGNDDPNTDPAYGYFSLTKRIDEGGNWNNINGYRYGAEYNNYSVEDGSTAQIYPNHNDDAFKIPPGVYRIEVDKDMESVHIIKYVLSMTFNPAGGTIVEPGQVVTATSNLDELVHAINPNEVNAQYYNTTDNWSHQENDNTAVINNVGETTMIANANIGYIHVEGQATYEIIGDLYLLGTANGRSAWVPYGPQFSYDANAEEYYIDVYFKGYNDDTNAEDGYGYFSLTTKIGSNDNDWGSIGGYRIYAATHDYLVEDGHTYQDCFQTGSDQAFKIPAGVYRITVAKDMSQMTVTEYPTTLTFNPASGTTVAAGDPVNITSNLDQLVHAINPDEDNATFKYATSTDGTLPTPVTEGSTVTITAVDATTTVNAQANIGYITATGNANYIVPAPAVYDITSVITPEGAGTVTAPAGAVEGTTVTFTVDANVGYQLDNVQVTSGYVQALVDYTYDSSTGEYSFVMPNDDVKIFADYNKINYSITTVVSPAGAGTITAPAGATAGETVNLTVTTNSPNTLTDVVLTYVDANNVTQIITLTPDGNGTYSFVMPTANVTVTANYSAPVSHNISTEVIPAPAGTIHVQSTAMTGETVNFTLTKSSSTTYDDYEVYAVTLTYNDSQQTTTLTPTGSTYSFVMPDEDVTITAEYRKAYMVRATWTPQNGGVVGIEPSNYYVSYKMQGTTVTFNVTPNANFELGNVRISSPSTLTFVDNGDGSYSFVMPNMQVNINATFVPIGAYQVNVVNDPAEAGSITLTGHVKTDNGNYYSDGGETVVITPNPANGWGVTGVDVVDANNNPVNVTYNDDGSYTLVMPASDVTITAHYNRVPFTITTQVTPTGRGVINLMGDAADNNEIAGQTVSFNVEPNYGYEINEVYYTYGGTNYPVTDDGNGTYSFVMPESNVTIVARLKSKEYIFRQVKHTRDIVEGGIYIYADTRDDLVLGRFTSGPELKAITPIEWLDNKREWVKVNSSAAMFEAVNVVDTTYTPQSSYYGLLDETDYKAAYLKLTDGTGYLGLPDNPSHPFGLEAFNVDNPYEQFENLRAQLRIQEHNVIWHTMRMADAVWSYYGHVWPSPLISQAYHYDDIYVYWNFGYFTDYQSVTLFVDNPMYLFKLPQPFTITTQCVEPDWGSVQLSVVDNIAMDGDIVTVTPTPNDGYACENVTVTINGTNESIDVTKNNDGSYSFEMPAADVTVTAIFVPGHKLTVTFNPVDFDNGEVYSVKIGNNTNYVHEPNCVYYDVLPGSFLYVSAWVNDYYTVESATITNDDTGESTILRRVEIVDGQLFGYDGGHCYHYQLTMPNYDATITFAVLPAHKVTCVTLLDGEENEDCGSINVFRIVGEDGSDGVPYYAENDLIYMGIRQNSGYRLDQLTVVNDDTGESIDIALDFELESYPGFFTEWDYRFTMPDADVTITAYYVPYTPLSYIEAPLEWGESFPVIGDEVEVSDELIGTWAAKSLLWVKDQDYPSINQVEQPAGSTDYVRQNMKLQKHEWDQSNWVVLEFSEIDGWTGSEEDLMRVEDYVDHKIQAGSIKGTYVCDGDDYKAQHMIILSDWPVIINPTDINSLGYPGYMQDPKEQLPAYDYKYNHYVPSNFLPEYIGGRFGQVGGEGAIPGNPAYENLRMFFMNPKDCEVAHVWAVWLGSMEFYDEYENGTVTGDVFETFEPDYDGGVNVFNFAGAFYVPSWEFNRRSLDRDDYGFPDGENTLEKNAEYLFHVAIMAHGKYGEEEPPDEPQKAPRRGQGTQAMNVEPWTYYSVFPLDLDPSSSITTSVRELSTPGSTTIDSIRYYNVMGQESETPFDGINIMVIRYKDGSYTSKKVLK